jgi:hypothetical protein
MYNNSGNHEQPQSCNSSPEMRPIIRYSSKWHDLRHIRLNVHSLPWLTHKAVYSLARPHGQKHILQLHHSGSCSRRLLCDKRNLLTTPTLFQSPWHKFCCTGADKDWEFVTYNFLFTVLVLLFLPDTVLLLAQYHIKVYWMTKIWSYTISPTVTFILDCTGKLCNWFLQNFNCVEISVILGCDAAPLSISSPTFRDVKLVPRGAQT